MKTIWFVYPYGSIPGENSQCARYINLGRELSKNYNCIWWTSNYSRGLKRFRSDGLKEIAVQENLSIMLVPTISYQKSISFKRILFELNYSRNMNKIWKKAERPDLIITPGTGMITAFRPVWPYIRRHNVKALFDIMDVHLAESFIQQRYPILYPCFMLLKWFCIMREKGFYNSVVAVTALGRKQLEIAKQRAGNRDIPSCLIYNSIYVDEFRDLMKGSCSIELPEKNDWIWCIYAGSLNPSYDIPTVIECARKCEMNNKKILFIIAGRGEYTDLCNSNKHVLFLGYKDKSIITPIYGKCDVGLCTYADFSTVDMPDKFYDYTAAGLAIVNSLNGELKEQVEARKLGVQYRAGNSDDLYEQICRFEDTDYLTECKENSWNIAREFDFKNQVDKLKTMIDALV